MTRAELALAVAAVGVGVIAIVYWKRSAPRISSSSTPMFGTVAFERVNQQLPAKGYFGGDMPGFIT